MRFSGILFLLLRMTPCADSQTALSPELKTRRKALNDALDEQWQYNLSTNPEYASVLGDKLVESETDRYIVWPGQALSYKVGQLTIMRLREKAKASLGAKFDIRSFHDEVLGAGALPMSVLTERIDQWIERQKKS